MFLCVNFYNIYYIYRKMQRKRKYGAFLYHPEKTVLILDVTLSTVMHIYLYLHTRFSGGFVIKNPPAKERDAGSVLGLGRSPGGGSGNPLQYSCLENPMDRGGKGGCSLWGHKVRHNGSDSVHTQRDKERGQ